jgi:hypothetical protein
LGGLRDDAVAVRRVLERIGEPVVLVGHSYLGAVISELAGSPLVLEAVYVAAFWPKNGQCMLDLINAMTVDVQPGLAETAVSRLGLQSVASAMEKSATEGGVPRRPLTSCALRR